VGRRVALRQISARPAHVAAEDAIAAARTAQFSRHFPQHFKQTRRLRFSGGQVIPATVPVRVIWGDHDHIARARASRHTDELPAHAVVETWERCGHMVMWDAPVAVLDAALALSPKSTT
jgi:pimeloyl-ACP methyl ester carboxylesterase